MMNMHEHIDIGDFDREYGLTDLLPADLARDLLGDVSRHVPMAIIQPDGRMHCDLTLAGSAPSCENISFQPVNGRFTTTPVMDRTRHFPLRHELEDIGFLVLGKTEEPPETVSDWLGLFIAKTINRIIRMMYANRMTAGLHVQVVETSYGQLKDKADKLQESEEKYRKLSQNLEAEVLRQTEEIKTTQLMLLQQEKLASIGQLAAGMAHEINNPIGFITSNLNTLAANARDAVHMLRQSQRLIELCNHRRWDAGDTEFIRREAIRIKDLGRKLDIGFILNDMQALISESLDGAARIGTIMENLRDFAHPSVDSIETTDINHCLDTTLSILGRQISAGITIRKHYRNIPKASCYLRELNQVFFQILRNAIQAVGDKGDILIDTKSVDEKTIEVIIADTGSGIPASHQAHLFEPFFSTRPVGSGAGLGLHLAHNIITKHGGRIDVVSKEGAGSIFKVHIPVNRQQKQSEPAGNQK